MDNNWTTPKYNFKKHSRHDSPWWQPFTRYISLSKRKAKIKNQAGFLVFDKFTLQANLGDESGGV